MAVQYNSDTGSWTTWIDKLKQEVPTVKKEISEFFELMNAQGVPLNKWAKSNDEVFDKLCKKYKVTNTELKNFLRTWDGSGDVAEAFQAHLKKSTNGLTLFQRAGKAAGTAMRTLGATLGSMAAMWAIGEVLSLAATGINNYIHRVDNAREALEEFNSTVQEQQSNLSSQKEWIDKNGAQYEKLAEGVDQYGHNISLTSDEFTEYKNLTKEIANMFPSIVQGYNDQNEAILKNKGSVEELTDAYEKNQKAYYNDIMAKSGDTFDKFKTVTKSDLSKKNNLSDLINSNFSKEQTEGLLSNYASFESTFGKTLGKSLTKELFNALNDEFKHNATLLSGQSFDAIDFTKISPQLQEKVRSVFSELNQTIDTESEKVRPILQAYLYGQSSGYSSLDDTAKSAVQSFVQNVDSSFFEQFDSDTDMETWLTNNVINPLKDGINNEDLAVRIQTLFSLNEKDFKSYADYVKAVLDIINNLAQMTDKNGKKIYTKQQINNLKTQFGVGDVDSDGNVSGQKKIDNAVAKFKNIKGADKYIRELNEDDLETVLYKLEPDKVTSLKDLKDFVKNDVTSETQKATNQSFEEAWGSLKDSEQKKFTTLLKNGRLTAETFNEVGDAADTLKATGLSVNTLCDNIRSFVGLQTKLENMSTAFKKVGTAYQDFKKNGYVSTSSLNSMPDAFKNLKGYSDFSKVAGNKKSSKSEIQGAFNDIVSEYINTFHILDNVTDKTKNKIITALRDAGVTNANDLISQYQKVDKANTDLLNKAEKNYIKYLNSKGTNNEITNKKLNSMNAGLINALGKQYQDDYNNWLDLLKKKEQAYNSFVSAYNSANIETQKQYKKNKASKSVISSNQKNKQLNTDVSSIMNNPLSAEAQNTINASRLNKLDEEREKANKEEKKARNKMRLKLNKVDARYDAQYSPTTSSSNGRSGSKKSKSKKTKQEIDWIARKLEVLQKAIDTTSGKLQNLFSIKAKKNNINKQITETTALLKANRKAAKAYTAEANKVKLGGKLKAKVRSGDYDITKYSSKTADKINKYQDLIDKAREAQDAVQDNIASIHDLNQQKLDNITTWYDKLLEKIDAVTSKLQAKSDLTSKVRGMLGQAETGTKTEYTDTLKNQKSALKTSQTELKNYNKERRTQRNKLVNKNKSNRQTTEDFLKRSGLSKKAINKELKKFDKKNDVSKQLADFDATTKAEAAKLKENVYSAMSEMLDTAQSLANIPLEKLSVTLDKLSTQFTVLENQASRATKEIENAGTGLGYYTRKSQAQIDNKSSAQYQARLTKETAVSSRDAAANKLRAKGVDPSTIKTASDLEKFANNTDAMYWASQYLAGVSAVNDATSQLSSVQEDYASTVSSVTDNIIDERNKLYENERSRKESKHTNDEKEYDYTDVSLKDRLDTIDVKLDHQKTDTVDSIKKQADKSLGEAAHAADSFYGYKTMGYLNSQPAWVQNAFNKAYAFMQKGYDFNPETDNISDAYISSDILEALKQAVQDGYLPSTEYEQVVKYNANIADGNNQYQTYTNNKATYDYETLPNSFKEIFSTISDDADRTVSDIQRNIDAIENSLDSDLFANKTDSYKKEADYYANQKQVYVNEGDALRKQLALAEAKGLKQGSDTWNELMNQIHTADDNAEKAAQSYTNAVVNAFNSIGDIADRKITEIGKSLSNLDTQMSLYETQGHFITSEFYNGQGDLYQQQQEAELKKAADLQAELDADVASNKIKEYSSDWYEMKDKIDEATQSADDYSVKIAESTNKAFDAILQLGEKSREAITRMNDEADFYKDILGRNKLVNEKTGAFTANGVASISLSYEKMTNDIVDNQNIQREIEAVQKRYKNGNNPEYGIEQYNKDMDNLLSQQREAIKNYYDEREAVMSLISDGLQKQLDVLQDIVDKTKEAMDRTSDLRDYQNNVEEATKNISSLEKQLAVVQGNDSEEGRATAQSLQKQLEDAQKNLDDLEWDKKKSDMTNILDDLMENAQDYVDEKRNQVSDTLDEIRDSLQEDAPKVIETLQGLDDLWGTSMSDAFKNAVSTGDYSTITNSIDSAASKIAQAVYDSEKSKLESTPKPVIKETDQYSSKAEKLLNQYASKNVKVGTTGFEIIFDQKMQDWKEGYHLSTDSARKILKELTDYNVDGITDEFVHYMLIDTLKANHIGGFAKGGIIGALNEQVRKNNDDALISVQSGEGILTPQQTEMFQRLVGELPALVNIADVKVPNFPTTQNTSKTVNVELGDMHFDLPNVTDTDSFINAWKTDNKMKNFVSDVVTGAVTGDNSKAMRY